MSDMKRLMRGLAAGALALLAACGGAYQDGHTGSRSRSMGDPKVPGGALTPRLTDAVTIEPTQGGKQCGLPL